MPQKKKTPLTKSNKYIESPERMYELFCEYVDTVKAKPFHVRDWVGAMATQVERPKEKPLTLEGFSNYCFHKGIVKDTDDYFVNTKGNYDEYSSIC